MINLVLLSGFLGAGKTTLMTSILEAYEDKKIGVVVNEFGKVNIDAVLIRKDGIEIAELSNGSIFCACIKDYFVDSLIELSYKDLEYLFIEASGLADPSNMPQILEGIKHKVKENYAYKGAICVVDGETFLELAELLPALDNQIEYSKTAIINKMDLIDENRMTEVIERIKEINSGIDIIPTSYCQADIRGIIENFDVTVKEGGETTNTFESRPKTFILKGIEVIEQEKLEAFLHSIAQDTYRVKGFAATQNGNVEISSVGKHVNINSWKEAIKENEIVIISSVGIKLLSTITTALKIHLDGKMSIVL